MSTEQVAKGPSQMKRRTCTAKPYKIFSLQCNPAARSGCLLFQFAASWWLPITVALVTASGTSCWEDFHPSQEFVTEFRIVDAQTGLPIAGAAVTARAEATSPRVTILQSADATVALGPTDSNGLTWAALELQSDEITTNANPDVTPQINVEWHLTVRQDERNEGLVVQNTALSEIDGQFFQVSVASIQSSLPQSRDPILDNGHLQINAYVVAIDMCDHVLGRLARYYSSDTVSGYIGATDLASPIVGFSEISDGLNQSCTKTPFVGDCPLTITVYYDDANPIRRLGAREPLAGQFEACMVE